MTSARIELHSPQYQNLGVFEAVAVAS
jgi:hypothetical protein